MALFDTLGFRWDRASIPRELPRASRERVAFRFSRMLPEYVWDAGVLEGNPFTFPEVKTLLEGVTVGGRKLSDQEQILNLADSARFLVDLVKLGQFRLDKTSFCSLNARVARDEVLEWGHFRGEASETLYTPDVALGERGRYTPLPTEPGAPRLNEVFVQGTRALEQHVSNPFERAAAFFLFGSLQQFFFDGNKRTARFMMNGMLMSEGIDAISIPAVRAAEFNSRMVSFYLSRDASEMMAFVLDCHPEIAQIRQLNPQLCVIRDLPVIQYTRLSDPIDERQPDDVERTSIAAEKGRRRTMEEVRLEAARKWKELYHLGTGARTDPKDDVPDADRGARDKYRDLEP